jgi:transcriptional regulator NrdR family protein
LMRTQLKVIKVDGSLEEYSHTKVMGTINNALCKIGHRQNRRTATSSEIFSIIKAALSAVNYDEAAIGLTEHHFQRRLKRSRTEVVSIDIQELTDAEQLTGTETTDNRCRWDKSRIVEDLVIKYDLTTSTARTIASMVEEKIFNIGINLVPSSLIKQLVLGDTATVLRAQEQLQTA